MRRFCSILAHDSGMRSPIDKIVDAETAYDAWEMTRFVGDPGYYVAQIDELDPNDNHFLQTVYQSGEFL